MQTHVYRHADKRSRGASPRIEAGIAGLVPLDRPEGAAVERAVQRTAPRCQASKKTIGSCARIGDLREYILAQPRFQKPNVWKCELGASELSMFAAT